MLARTRRATPRDVAAARDLIAAALAEYGLPFEPDGRDADVNELGARDDNDDLVAEDEHGLIGIVSVGPHGDAGVAWISKVFVSRRARRVGVGRALLRAAHDAAIRRGYVTVGLRTRTVFREAIALYESEGYVCADGDARRIAGGDLVYYRALRRPSRS